MMKKLPFRKILLLSALACAWIHECSLLYADESVLTAAEYCSFLNQNTASDFDFLFDHTMESDPKAACIVRLGTPGKYSYQVIVGRENFPVTYISEFDEEKYCDWLQNRALIDDDIKSDSYLKSNTRVFEVDSSQSSQMLSLEKLTPLKNNSSFLNGTNITGIGLTFLAIMMVRDGLPSSAYRSSSVDSTASAVSADFSAVRRNSLRVEQQRLRVMNATSARDHLRTSSSSVALEASPKLVVNNTVRELASSISEYAMHDATQNVEKSICTWRDVVHSFSPEIQQKMRRRLLKLEKRQLVIGQVLLKDFLESLPSFYEQVYANKVDVILLRSFEKAVTHYDDALRENKISLALSWRNIAEDSQRVINADIKKKEAPEGSLLRKTWDDAARTSSTLVELKTQLIEADSASNQAEICLLGKLLKTYERIAGLRHQLADALQRGDIVTAQRLSASDDNEVFEKIEQYRSLQRTDLLENNNPEQHRHAKWLDALEIVFGWKLRAENTNSPTYLYKKLVGSYESLLRCKQVSKLAANEGEVSPEVSQAFLDAEQSYSAAIEVRVKAVDATPAVARVLGKNADALEEAANYKKRAAQTMQSGNPLKARQWIETAEGFEKVVEVANHMLPFLERNNRVAASHWGRAAQRFYKFAQALAVVNDVLSKDADGIMHQNGLSEAQRIQACRLVKGKSDIRDIEGDDFRDNLLGHLDVLNKEANCLFKSAQAATSTEGDVHLNDLKAHFWKEAATEYLCSRNQRIVTSDLIGTFPSESIRIQYLLEQAEFSVHAAEALSLHIEDPHNHLLIDRQVLIADRWKQIKSESGQYLIIGGFVTFSNTLNLIKESMRSIVDSSRFDERKEFLRQLQQLIINRRILAIEAIESGQEWDAIHALDQLALEAQQAVQRIDLRGFMIQRFGAERIMSISGYLRFLDREEW